MDLKIVNYAKIIFKREKNYLINIVSMAIQNKKTIPNEYLPKFFEAVLWSYDFASIDPDKDKKLIIINAINYGNLGHWRWLALHYGKDAIKKILEKSLTTEIRPQARKLASIIFSVKKFNYAQRSIKR